MDAVAVGYYRVGREISTLPTSELIFPIMRAVFPGYSAVAHDKKLLAKTFLNVQAAIVTLTFPAGVWIALLADPIVKLLLGPNWLDTIPLIQILGFYGAISVLQATNFSIFTVLGKPHLSAAIRGFEVMLLLPSLGIVLSFHQSLVGVALTILAVHTLSIPVSMYYLSKLIPISAKDRMAVTWRPFVATGVMLAAVVTIIDAMPATGGGIAASAMLLSVAVLGGAVIYALSLYLLWGASRKPDGPEKVIQEMLTRWLGRARNE
jgi:O-antigen/teichoic acid export membrane protein